MGKTAAGAVWLNAELFSPYDYWQFWRNTEDADVGRFLRLFTLMPLDEIARLEALQGAEINEAKKTLASEATRLLHGDAAAARSGEDRARDLRGRHGGGEPPNGRAAARQFEAGLGVLAAFVRAGLVASNGEARRQIKGGGLRLNDVAVTDERCDPSRLRPYDRRRGQAVARPQAPRPAEARAERRDRGSASAGLRGLRWMSINSCVSGSRS